VLCKRPFLRVHGRIIANAGSEERWVLLSGRKRTAAIVGSERARARTTKDPGEEGPYLPEPFRKKLLQQRAKIGVEPRRTISLRIVGRCLERDVGIGPRGGRVLIEGGTEHQDRDLLGGRALRGEKVTSELSFAKVRPATSVKGASNS